LFASKSTFTVASGLAEDKFTEAPRSLFVLLNLLFKTPT